MGKESETDKTARTQGVSVEEQTLDQDEILQGNAGSGYVGFDNQQAQTGPHGNWGQNFRSRRFGSQASGGGTGPAAGAGGVGSGFGNWGAGQFGAGRRFAAGQGGGAGQGFGARQGFGVGQGFGSGQSFGAGRGFGQQFGAGQGFGGNAGGFGGNAGGFGGNAGGFGGNAGGFAAGPRFGPGQGPMAQANTGAAGFGAGAGQFAGNNQADDGGLAQMWRAFIMRRMMQRWMSMGGGQQQPGAAGGGAWNAQGQASGAGQQWANRFGGQGQFGGNQNFSGRFGTNAGAPRAGVNNPRNES